MRSAAIERLKTKDDEGRTSLMLIGGRILFGLGIAGAAFGAAMTAWLLVWFFAGLNALGALMWMLGAIETRLIEIANVLRTGKG
jgi:hypothetical protein